MGASGYGHLPHIVHESGYLPRSGLGFVVNGVLLLLLGIFFADYCSFGLVAACPAGPYAILAFGFGLFGAALTTVGLLEHFSRK
jgi:hypothetical protein